MPFPNPDTQFKPGQSGNPGGHSKHRREVDALCEMIDEMGVGTAITRRWLKEVLGSKDFRWFKEFLDRKDGKVADVVRVDEDAPRPHEIPEEDERFVAGDEHAAVEGHEGPDAAP